MATAPAIPIETSPPVMPAIIPQTEVKEAASLIQRAAMLVITKGSLGTTKSVDSEKVTVNTDKKALFISKELLTCKELKAIWRLDNRMANFIAYQCLPSFLKHSVYLLPVGMIINTDARLVEHKAKRKELVNIFIDTAYDKAIEDAKLRLKPQSEGGLFNPEDYLSKEEARKSFYFSWNYVEMGPSNQLKAISQALYDREKEKAEVQWKDAQAVIIQLLRRQAQELVKHMVDLVTPAEPGKRKVFRKTSLNGINEFINTFGDKNLGNDTELQKLIQQADQLLKGVTPDGLKSDEVLRATIQTTFTTIKDQLATMVTDAPIRSMRFDE